MALDVSMEFVHLAAGPPPWPGQLQTRQVGSKGVRLGLDGSGAKHVLLPSPGKFTPDTRSRGVHLLEQPFVLDGAEVLFADLVCADSALDMVFDRLAQDVVSRVEESDQSPLSSCAQVLEQWRELLRRGSELSESAIVGLVGELHMLHLLAERDPMAALEAWTGPRRTIHDFVRSNHAIEVKSSASVEGTAVRINGWDQLDPAEVSSLHLAVIHCRQSEAAPTLDERIDKIAELGVPLQPLLSKVALTGYLYEGRQTVPTRYRVVSTRLWTVTPDFPGLRRSSLPEAARRGVSQLQYVLATDSAPARIPDNAAEAFLNTWLAL